MATSFFTHKTTHTFTLMTTLFCLSLLIITLLFTKTTTDLSSSTLTANLETEPSGFKRIVHENGTNGHIGKLPKSELSFKLGSESKDSGFGFNGSVSIVDANWKLPKSDLSLNLGSESKDSGFGLNGSISNIDAKGQSGKLPKSELSLILESGTKDSEFGVNGSISKVDENGHEGAKGYNGESPNSKISPVLGSGSDGDETRVWDGEGESENNGLVSFVEKWVSEDLSNVTVGNGDGEVGMVNEVKWDGEGCDLYMGKWVRDDENYPVYRPGECPYVDEGFDCQSYGRPDDGYMKWRWKPDGCDLPRFSAIDFLNRLRGKRLMLVGDSMNRNQFESMLCLLQQGLPDKSKMFEIHGYKITKGRGYYVFKFMDYNCTVEFVRSHFLVREGVRINGQGNSNPTLSIDRIDKTAARWKKADILIFNTGHWWTHGKTARG